MGLLTPGSHIRLQVFPGDCPAKTTLADGTAEGAVLVDSLDHSKLGQGFTVDGLEPAPYCFAATLVDSSCLVLAFGATPADLAKHEHITTAINERVDPPAGGCDAEQTCQDGWCEPF